MQFKVCQLNQINYQETANAVEGISEFQVC